MRHKSAEDHANAVAGAFVEIVVNSAYNWILCSNNTPDLPTARISKERDERPCETPQPASVAWVSNWLPVGTPHISQNGILKPTLDRFVLSMGFQAIKSLQRYGIRKRTQLRCRVRRYAVIPCTPSENSGDITPRRQGNSNWV